MFDKLFWLLAIILSIEFDIEYLRFIQTVSIIINDNFSQNLGIHNYINI